MAQEGAMNMVESTRVRVSSKSPVSIASSSSTPPPRISATTATTRCCPNHDSFKRSAVPVRFMFFNNEGSWTDFPTEVIGSLKAAFVNRKPMVDLSISGTRYLFDFMRMLQIDFESGSQRSISWIDENGKCFFPKVFIGEDFDLKPNQQIQNPKIEIEIRIDNTNNNGKRKREELGLPSLCKEEPEVSSSMKGDDMKRQRLEWPSCVRLLSESEDVYAISRDYFLNGMRKVDPDVTITAIRQWKLDAPLEKARFISFRTQIRVTQTAPVRGGTPRVVYAWYGASVKDMESVLMHGFGAPNKVYGPDSYGIGVYMSPVQLPHISAKLSDVDVNGEKHVLLCRVILGNLEQVVAGSQQDCPSSRYFDTGADDTENPKWYVVWPCNMSRHIIPECVVSFKHSTQYIHGQLKGSNGVRYSLEKLLAKMKNFLPLVKFREMEKLCNMFRAGKLPRDMFVKRMRWVAGDEVLRSTIKEIQSQE